MAEDRSRSTSLAFRLGATMFLFALLIVGIIVTDVKAASDLVSSIATASQEQAQGVEQINGAVGQMDKVTQQNAAVANKPASSRRSPSAVARLDDASGIELDCENNGHAARDPAKDAGALQTF